MGKVRPRSILSALLAIALALAAGAQEAPGEPVAALAAAGARRTIAAPAEWDISAAIAFPSFQAGGLAEFLAFPWAIDIGKGNYNYLGLGAGTGLLLMFGDDLTLGIPLYGIFAGRFGMLPKTPVDWLVRMGYAVNAGLYGSSDFAVNIKSGSTIFRPRLGFMFFTNPAWEPGGYESEFLYSALLSFGVALPKTGIKGTVLF